MQFAVFLPMIGGWNLFQINAMTTQITEVTGGNKVSLQIKVGF